MRATHAIFVSTVFASIALFGCTSKDTPQQECEFDDIELCEPNTDDSSSSEDTETSSSSSSKGSSSSSLNTGTSSTTGSSSSSRSSSSSYRSSSSAAQSTVTCVVRTAGMPSNPTSTCFRGEGNYASKCYICPSDQNCTNSGFWSNWGWDNAWPDQGWLTEVSCGSGVATSSSATSQQQSSSSRASSSSISGGSTYQVRPKGNQSGTATQYWDACKPSCSWSDNGGSNRARSCNITGSNLGSTDNPSACSGGSEFTCMNQAPWKVGNVSFGYVAFNEGSCGTCYQLDFPNGHVMVVMKSNIGSINGKFDLMIPGGGVGDFDALTRQVQNSGVSNPNMGERYGGFRGACGWEYSTSNVQCVRDKCNSVFANLPDLKAGCLWYANTLGTDNASWDNPTVYYQEVPCPSELTSKY